MRPFASILRITALLLLSCLLIAPGEAQTIIKKGNPNNRSIPFLMVDPTSSVSAGKTGLTGAAVGTAVGVIQSTDSGGTASGATSLIVASATNFPTSGSVWVPTQNAVITYTGISTNTLTGIPASGAGSITAAVPAGTLVTTGIAGSFTIKWTINAGTGQGYPFLGSGSVIEFANGEYEYIPSATESASTVDVHYVFSASTAIDYNASAVFQTTKVDDLGAALLPGAGAAIAGSTTTVIDTNLTAAAANCYKGQILVFTSGANVGQTSIVQSNTSGANSVLTVMTAYSSAPSATDTFNLVVGVPQKTVDFLAALGTDNRPLISANTHTAGATVAAVAGSVASVTGGVTVTTNNDKTGYALSGTQAFNLTGNITGNVSGSVGSVTGAVGSVTGNVTVGAFAGGLVPANFASLSIDTSGRVTLTPSEHALISGTDIVNGLNTVLPGSITAGSAYAKLNAASSAGDPWATSLPGTYAAGTAGAILSGLKMSAPSWYTAPSDPFGLSKGSYGAGTWGSYFGTQLANAVPSDYQQRGVAVTLPSTVLQSADLTAIWTQPVEGSITARQLLGILGAYAAGNTNTTAKTYSAIGGTATRITYGIDSSGNRTITLTLGN